MDWLMRYLHRLWHEWWPKVKASPGTYLPIFGVGLALGIFIAWSATAYLFEERVKAKDATIATKDATITFLNAQIVTQRSGGAKGDVLLGYGATGPFCIGQIDGERILELQNRFMVGIVCIENDNAAIDRFTDERITMSELRTIGKSIITVVTPWSPAMAAYQQEVFEKGPFGQALKNCHPPQGMIWLANVPKIYETVVLPRGTKMALIKTLADIPRNGGKILSEEGYQGASKGSGM